jgi:hypothetical protein
MPCLVSNIIQYCRRKRKFGGITDKVTFLFGNGVFLLQLKFILRPLSRDCGIYN